MIRRQKTKAVRRHKPRVSRFAAGLIASLVILAACYLVFGGSLPFSGAPFVLKAVFTSNTQLHIPSPVRIAGVDVGEVTSVNYIAHSRDAAVVTMDINRNGLPIHSNATALIRSRIFLEGNFYVDLSPGSPSAPVLQSGDTLPASNTSGPVQLDRVLSALSYNARGNLQTLLQGLGAALNSEPTAAEDAGQDPIVKGLTGGQSLNKSLQYSAGAFRASAIVNEALLGIEPHDLSNAVIGNEEVFKGLADSGNRLASFVHTFNLTLGALASRQQALSQTISLLPSLLRNTQSSDSALDASFGPTQQFAKAILPGIEQLGPTIDAALPWLPQATALASRSELGGLLHDLSPAIDNTGRTITATHTLISGADQLAECFTNDIVPTGNEVIQDGPASSGEQVYQELFQSAVGIAGAAGNFDGNGRYLRASAGGGDILTQTPPVPSYGPFYGNAILPVLGTRPAYTGKVPPLDRDVPCYRNAAPNLNSAKTGPAQ